MKKTYSARRNALFTLTELSWGARGLLLVALLLVVRLAMPNVFWQITSPLFRAANAVAGVNHAFLSSFTNAATVSLENDELRKQNESLVVLNATLMQKLGASEGASAGAASPKGEEGIRAEVVARPPESPYDVIVLAQGTRAGVSLGMEAFGPSGAPLGVVAAVSQDFSHVLLFSSPDVRTAGWVGSESVPVTIVGAGGGALQVSLARSANVSVGDTLYVPGPGMLPLGIVARVDDDPSSPAVILRIRPLSNPFSLGAVTLRATGVRGSATLLVATSTPR